MMHSKGCMLVKGIVLLIVGLLWLGGDLAWWSPIFTAWTTWIALLILLAGLSKLVHGVAFQGCYEMSK